MCNYLILLPKITIVLFFFFLNYPNDQEDVDLSLYNNKDVSLSKIKYSIIETLAIFEPSQLKSKIVLSKKIKVSLFMNSSLHFK